MSIEYLCKYTRKGQALLRLGRAGVRFKMMWASDEWFFSEALRCVYWIGADIAVVGESAGRCALLRVPAPASRAPPIFCRKAHHPTDSASVLVRWQGEIQKVPAVGWRELMCAACCRNFDFEGVRHGDWAMRPGYCVKGARPQALAYPSFNFACVFTPKPHAHDPVAGPG